MPSRNSAVKSNTACTAAAFSRASPSDVNSIRLDLIVSMAADNFLGQRLQRALIVAARVGVRRPFIMSRLRQYRADGPVSQFERAAYYCRDLPSALISLIIFWVRPLAFRRQPGFPRNPEGTA